MNLVSLLFGFAYNNIDGIKISNKFNHIIKKYFVK